MFSTRLRYLISSSGKTQKDVGKEIGISQQRINNYARGLSTPDISTLCQIADYFHVSVDYLVGHDVAPDPVFQDIQALYLSMNQEGRELLRDHADTLVRSEKYIKKSPPAGLGEAPA